MISQDRARKIKLILMKISGNGNSRYSLQMSLLTANKLWGVWEFCDVCFLLDLVKAGDAGCWVGFLVNDISSFLSS